MIDVLGLADTFNQLDHDIINYYNNAIDIKHVTKTVESFSNAMIEAIQKQGEIERTRNIENESKKRRLSWGDH